MLRLYHVPLCPYCRKIRLALREKQLVFELVEALFELLDASILLRFLVGVAVLCLFEFFDALRWLTRATAATHAGVGRWRRRR